MTQDYCTCVGLQRPRYKKSYRWPDLVNCTHSQQRVFYQCSASIQEQYPEMFFRESLQSRSKIGLCLICILDRNAFSPVRHRHPPRYFHRSNQLSRLCTFQTFDSEKCRERGFTQSSK
ncbi:hypothetical protein DNFV4_00448 [Nitrospira tepida]|uniref:Uncharacterized protein n=1 Tax=Nitrospira tepida TaxID=2973512 RepID=A0AA86MW17_9BACT|nr:hypothetical protein DNFV4_00448 [Nitrospira tepida]